MTRQATTMRSACNVTFAFSLCNRSCVCFCVWLRCLTDRLYVYLPAPRLLSLAFCCAAACHCHCMAACAYNILLRSSRADGAYEGVCCSSQPLVPSPYRRGVGCSSNLTHGPTGRVLSLRQPRFDEVAKYCINT